MQHGRAHAPDARCASLHTANTRGREYHCASGNTRRNHIAHPTYASDSVASETAASDRTWRCAWFSPAGCVPPAAHSPAPTPLPICCPSHPSTLGVLHTYHLFFALGNPDIDFPHGVGISNRAHHFDLNSLISKILLPWYGPSLNLILGKGSVWGHWTTM